MLQIKVFTCDKIQDLEPAVNEWMRSTMGIEIVQIVQTENGGGNCPWSITLTVLYKPQPQVF
jgi:hypothetical protein